MQVNNILPTSNTVSEKGMTANRLEQAFLEEMLKYCGPAARQGEFGGGAGEDQFNSFLTREYAARLSGRLNLGLDAALGQGGQA